ncbi:MAG: hypothetical protein UY04_C0028G0010 [Parcubacteria group bacterium GW2011_GWA2_47_7]|nr:MAG: hypothetical protein UY04_C0028G0010 [Parcubacteria group bacterium GW2011_GWA2_47_7]
MLIAFLVGAGLGALLGAYLHKETIVVREGTPDTPAAMTSVNLMLDEGNGTIKTWNTVSWHETMSVLNLLETVTVAEHIVLLTKDNGSNGRTVTSIDSVENATSGTTTMRWQYWVNNTYEPRVASKYYLKPGDIVIWKYAAELAK